MKICLVGDTHFGVRKNSEIFLQSQIAFFKNQLVPYLIKHKIKEIVILGDLYDNRSNTNNKIMNDVFDLFCDVLKQFKVYLIVGNHDTYYNSSIEINSLNPLRVLPNVTLIDKIVVSDHFNKDKPFVFVPWIVDNAAFLDKFSKIEKPSVMLGHFNIHGFKFNKYKTSDDGLENRVFDRCEKVFSGHFHIRNKQMVDDTEIVYIGSPYQLTRNDMDEERGFVILDTETLDYEFIDNTVSLKFIQLKYPEMKPKELIEGNIVDILVNYEESYDESKLEKYIQKVEECNPADTPKIIINNPDDEANSVELNINVGSVTELIKEYIDLMDIKNKEDIYNSLIDLYNDAKGDLD